MARQMSPNLEVDQPIINDAFEEPTRHWLIRRGEQPVLVDGRRPAFYYFRPARLGPGDPSGGLRTDLDLVNRIRQEVKRWRTDGYPGASSVTRDLLDYWVRPERDRKMVFSQREAAEAVIFLREAPPQYKQGLSVPRDEPTEERKGSGYAGFERLCVKMATGTGKTTVMGLVAAWSILNAVRGSREATYSDTILVLCPNVTIRDRLVELDPRRGDASIYRARDIVPPRLMPDLARGTVIITNWHTLQPHAGNEVGGVTSAVVNKGPESDRALIDRVLGPSARGRKNVLVFNDEAHHAYRIPQAGEDAQTRLEEVDEAEDEERKEATVWVDGLDKLQKQRGINFALDLSATPLVRYGPDAGRMFPWVVSDFGLVDAIECGLVKIPQLPVADPTASEIPKYFNIWEWIVEEKLSAKERGGRRGSVKPEAIVAHAMHPIRLLAEDWRKTFNEWAQAAARGEREPVPPVFIIVCRDTRLAKALHETLATPPAGEPPLVPEFVNRDGVENTVRIDSKVAQEMDAGSRSTEARRLRFVLDTVGKHRWPGDQVPEEWEAIAKELDVDPRIPPGRDVRCIVSVGMLTEGWDARTVTHIIGIRPFQSQLLCEQVVGRALRRSQWTDLKIEEVARIFGVPFEVVPFKAAAPKASGEKPRSTHVFSRPDREALKITFPRVERFVPIVAGRLTAAWERIPKLVLDPMEVPDETVVQGISMDEQGQITRSGPGRRERLTLEAARKTARIQELEFRLSRRLTQALHAPLQIPPQRLFAELLPLVRTYLRTKVAPKGGYRVVDVLFYEPWLVRAFEDLAQGLGSADTSGEVGELPVYEMGRPEGSTAEVDFWTARPVYETVKSHLNFAVADTGRWEQAAAYYLEQDAHVISYAKNFDMGFTIPYVWKGERHEYHPDYLVRLQQEGREVGTAIVEVKGYMDERAMVQAAAARRWVDAVNRDGRYGRWEYTIADDPTKLTRNIGIIASEMAAGTQRKRTLGGVDPLATG